MRRWIGSVAAAAVVLVGIGAAFTMKDTPKQDAPLYADSAVTAAEHEAEPALASGGVVSNGRGEAAPGAVVEADGVADEAVAIEEEALGMTAGEAAESAVASQRAPACELALRVADVKTACDRVCDLAQEYEAVADVQAAGDGGASVYVEIDAENAGDFLSAVAPMDNSGSAVEVPAVAGSGRVLVLLVLHGE